MQTFKNLIRQYPNNLFAKELDNVKFNFPTGATYLFGNDAKYALSFSIDMTQADVGSSENASFGYACVDLNKKSELNKVEERLKKINDSLRECNIDMIKIYRQKVNSSLEEARVVQPFRGSGLDIV